MRWGWHFLFALRYYVYAIDLKFEIVRFLLVPFHWLLQCYLINFFLICQQLYFSGLHAPLLKWQSDQHTNQISSQTNNFYLHYHHVILPTKSLKIWNFGSNFYPALECMNAGRKTRLVQKLWENMFFHKFLSSIKVEKNFNMVGKKTQLIIINH